MYIIDVNGNTYVRGRGRGVRVYTSLAMIRMRKTRTIPIPDKGLIIIIVGYTKYNVMHDYKAKAAALELLT